LGKGGGGAKGKRGSRERNYFPRLFEGGALLPEIMNWSWEGKEGSIRKGKEGGGDRLSHQIRGGWSQKERRGVDTMIMVKELYGWNIKTIKEEGKYTSSQS